MRHIALFNGIGGFQLAAEWVGWENVAHVEINPFCDKIVKYHFPYSKCYEDIKEFSGKSYTGTIDIISGGFPCQPFSVAGKKAGADDDRYLWPEMCRVVDEVKPYWVVCENVTGITSMVQPFQKVRMEEQKSLFEKDSILLTEESEYILESICKDFERIGYSVQPFVLPACAIGAPHQRERVWIVAYSPVTGLEKMRERENSVLSPNANNERQQEQPERIIKEKAFSDGLHSQVVADPISQRFRGEINGYRKTELTDKNKPGNYWQNFPTQPPVCGGNDGIPRELDSITFSKWRRESIKAFGNAIVPQVAYEIFKIINEIHYD